MIRLTKPEVDQAMESIASVLHNGFLVQGKQVERFEAVVADYVGRRYGIAVNSGTSAIQCALMALGIGDGDEVIMPDFTFPATANAVVACGAVPVLVDIDLATFNMDPAAAEAKITSRTRALMPVDLFGLAADLVGLGKVCERRGVSLVEDSACGLGSRQGKGKCGSFGEVSALSFHPRKVVTTGEGGMVLTDGDERAIMVRQLRNHGIAVESGKLQFVRAGYNLRMNEIQACLGITQMAQIDGLLAGRRRMAAIYDHLLAEIEEITCPTQPVGYYHTYQSYVVLLDERINRDQLILNMKGRGVETTIGTYSVHVQPFYRDRLGYKLGAFPVSHYAFTHSLSLPIYPSMEEEVVQQVVSSLKGCIGQALAGK